MDEQLKHLEKRWRHWKFKNTAMLVVSLVICFFLADTPFVRNLVSFIGNFGYLGAFFVGILFVSVFTVAPASVILFQLADFLNPLGVAIAAGSGGLLGDYIILKYLKDRVFDELEPFFMDHGGKPLRKLFKTPYFVWMLPVIGAIIIMSPFPDEVGLGLMGLSKVKTWKLLLLLYLLDVVGVFLIIITAKSF